MAFGKIMDAKDAVAGSQASCHAVIDGRRLNLGMLLKFEAKIEKSMVEVPILGKTGKGNKASGWKGSGSCTYHFNTSIFTKYLEAYKDSGEDVYMEITVSNQDKTSAAGEQVLVLKQVNMNSATIATFDPSADYLSSDADFTFDDFSLDVEFDDLPFIDD